MSFLKLLCPDLFVPKVEDIDLEKLKNAGFNTLIFDLDNTLLGWRASSFSSNVLEWIEKARIFDFKMCIVSNCILKGRVYKLSKKIGIPSISKAVKPRRWAFREAIKFLNGDMKKTAIIGDQIFTDILGGNRLGVYTILVKPVDSREYFTTALQRLGEKIIIKGLIKKQMLNSVDYKGKRKI